jgi:hypothetical protein
MKQIRIKLENDDAEVNVWYGGISGNLYGTQMGTVATMRCKRGIFTGCAWQREDEPCVIEIGERKALERMIADYCTKTLFWHIFNLPEGQLFLQANIKKLKSAYREMKSLVWTALWDAGFYLGEYKSQSPSPTEDEINQMFEDAALVDSCNNVEDYYA